MVDGVIIHEAKIEHRGEIEHPGEVNGGSKLLRSHGADAMGGSLEVRFLPVEQIGDVLGFLLEARPHVEFVIGHFVEHLHVAGREVPGEFPCGARFGVKAEVAVRIGNCSKDSLRDFQFSF